MEVSALHQALDDEHQADVLSQSQTPVVGVFNVQDAQCSSFDPIPASELGDLCKIQSASFPNVGNTKTDHTSARHPLSVVT